MTHALIVIDVQNDFCPGGALAVPGGDEIVPGINALMEEFDAVVLTQDWHPAGHSSFASSHEGKAPLTWSRCPMAPGALARSLRAGQQRRRVSRRPRTDRAEMIVRKGYNPAIDSYSAFFENDHETPPGCMATCKRAGSTG
jgi:nicotinamidase/pyrazinamidase